jgi:hypothetical protein
MILEYPITGNPYSTASLPFRTGLFDVIGEGVRSIGATYYPVNSTSDEFDEYETYDLPDWDGYGAEPIARETVQAARGFKRLLPMDAPQPDIAPGGDGTIGFEWRLGAPADMCLILVDVGPGNLITARRIDETGNIERFPVTHLETSARALVKQLFS